MPAAIYTTENCRFAYQLNWSLSIFSNGEIPNSADWLPALQASTEPDCVRVLEYHARGEDVHQLLLSTKPHVSPSEAIRSVKGRCQHLLREQVPQAFRRNYHIQSVGSVAGETILGHVASQTNHHRMADERVQQRIDGLQIHNPTFDLSAVRRSSHGQFLYNLHLVLVHRERWSDVCEQSLSAIQDMLRRASVRHEHLLSDAGILSDHVHLALGCGVNESPLDVALGYLNNLAFVHGMKPVYQFGGYLGTFGSYDLGAIRNGLT